MSEHTTSDLTNCPEDIHESLCESVCVLPLRYALCGALLGLALLLAPVTGEGAEKSIIPVEPLAPELSADIPPLFEPLIPFLGEGRKEYLYLSRKNFPPPIPQEDIPPAALAEVDPASTPYPVVMEPEWEKYLKGGYSFAQYIAAGKEGNAGALAAIHDRTGYYALWGRLADALTSPGWSFGVNGFSSQGAPMGDGLSIYNWSTGLRLKRLAALAGYPKAMAEAGAYLDIAGFCPQGMAWPLEAALRGYDYGWDYVGYNFAKGCPEDGIPPDPITAWAAYDIECRHTDLPTSVTGACRARDKLAQSMTPEQLGQAQAKVSELLARRDTMRNAQLERQRERRERLLPAVRQAINDELDFRLSDQDGFHYLMSLEELQKVRDQ